MPAPGEVVEITSADGSILGIVEQAPDVRRGVVSMAHAWGGAPSEDDGLRGLGSNTGRLVSNAGHLDPRSGQPLMSAIPVMLQRPGAGSSETAAPDVLSASAQPAKRGARS